MTVNQASAESSGDAHSSAGASGSTEATEGQTARHGATIRDVLAGSDLFADQFNQLSAAAATASGMADASWRKTLAPMLNAISETMKTTSLTPSVLEAMKVPAISVVIREQQKMLDSFSRDVIRSMPQMPRVDAAKMLGITPARVSQLAKVETGRSVVKDLLSKMDEEDKLRDRIASRSVADFLKHAAMPEPRDEGTVDQLERLAALYREGLLTTEEFKQAKRRLLDD